MKDTAPASKGFGIIAVAGLFGLIAAGVAFVAFGYTPIAALFIGGIVAAIVAIVLLLGWRDAAPGPMGVVDQHAAPAPTTSDHAAPSAPAAAKPEPAAAAPVAETPEKAPTPAPTPAKSEPEPEVASAQPVVKSTLLAGETELEDRKGEWKYDGPGAEADPAPTAEEKPAPTPAPAAEPAGEAAKPTFLEQARDGGPDDLKQIKGVGPKLEKTLHEMGLFHFDQIATWGPAEQAWMDDNLKGFKGRATRDDWVGQAKVLAQGGTTEFSKKVDKGGVY